MAIRPALARRIRRKSKKSARFNTSDDPDMTPLINCIFLLLVFFMVATTFLTAQSSFAQVQTLVIGKGGVHWIDSIEETIGVDTAAVAAGTALPSKVRVSSPPARTAIERRQRREGGR